MLHSCGPLQRLHTELHGWTALTSVCIRALRSGPLPLACRPLLADAGQRGELPSSPRHYALLQVVTEDGAPKGAQGEGASLWNAQPFHQNPGAEVPDCPAGCARAQPLEVRLEATGNLFA